jgi:N-succinyldiaminopimelate aminotransferase
VCDEVYEHLVFAGARHVPLMTLPGMRDRCVRIGSAGKTFSLTGWKVGYVTAAPALLAPIAKAHQLTTFTTPPNLAARGRARARRSPDAYFAELAGTLVAQPRSPAPTGCERLGLPVLPAARDLLPRRRRGRVDAPRRGRRGLRAPPGGRRRRRRRSR